MWVKNRVASAFVHRKETLQPAVPLWFIYLLIYLLMFLFIAIRWLIFLASFSHLVFSVIFFGGFPNGHPMNHRPCNQPPHTVDGRNPAPPQKPGMIRFPCKYPQELLTRLPPAAADPRRIKGKVTRTGPETRPQTQGPLRRSSTTTNKD